MFWDANSKHETINQVASASMFAAFWPALYYFSRSVKPMGCVAYTAAYYLAWSQGVKPFLLGRL